MKTISVLIPTYTEEDNVVPMCDAVREEFAKNLPHYDYEIIFIDNCSKDKTRERLELLCAGDEKVKAIFNARNFGQSRSPYYGLMQTAGDCAVRLCADFQEPVEMIHRFVEEWEKGYKIVVGIKTSSKESKVMYALRSIYYKLVKKIDNYFDFDAEPLIRFMLTSSSLMMGVSLFTPFIIITNNHILINGLIAIFEISLIYFVARYIRYGNEVAIISAVNTSLGDDN